MTMSLTTESSKGLPLRTTFNVKPGGQTHTHKEEVDGFSCAFEYSCQGGTHEGEDNKALISEVEYDLDKRHNKVSSTDAFKSHLSFLMAGFTKEKEEL
ncbi:hypothetical protein MAR_024970 [Mya arenaria]|uniref:Uncharacterized protein n=1 Tax=Mya arenaria TaxID=6604 RepID=A0ABY7DSB1_MYAAR|nr:hypothetical protein MAR_024970 [Mya arenaria]